MSGVFSHSREQDIQYERDPSTLLDVDFQNFYEKLDGYTNVNKLKKTYHKKNKGSAKIIQQQKDKKTQAIRIANLIKKARRDNIIQQFINKLKMTITLNNLTQIDQQTYFSIGQRCDEIEFKSNVKTGKMPKIFQNQTFEFLSIIFKFIIFLSITYMNSLKIAFSDIGSLQILLVIFICLSVSYFTTQIFFMIYRVKSIKVPFWKNLYYWLQKQDKLWQLLINIGLFIQLVSIPSISKILIIFMMKHVVIQIRKFKKIQISHVVSINFQRYWELSKIILLNFCLAHILSIILNLMGQINVQGQDNWYINKNIKPDQQWFIKYIWGCYWGTNIMLSVGFGDISAENHIEALMLIFIQTFACIILAYNISQVSKILQNMTLMDQQKKLKFKVFNQMGQKYNFQDSFKAHILNHIDKSIEKKHQLAYIQENLIEQLPEKLKYEVKRQMNKNVFQEAFFFKNLTKKVQNLLAQKVNKIFAHPQEIILKNMETWKIFILRQGSLALTYKKGSSRNNGYVIEQFSVQQIIKPQLISLKFIRKQKIKGDLKALDFSILNALQIQQFQSFLKDYDHFMFQYYCSERDKTQYNKYDLQIRPCPICINSKHDKTECPRMHFVPLKQHIIYKNQFICLATSLKRSKIVIQRKKNKNFSALKFFRETLQQSFLLPNSTGKHNLFIQPNLMTMHSMFVQNNDISKKIDKCLSKLEQGLKIIKGDTQTQQLVYDSAYNYKKYFPKNNPENLEYIFLNIHKKNEKQKNFLNRANLL